MEVEFLSVEAIQNECEVRNYEGDPENQVNFLKEQFRLEKEMGSNPPNRPHKNASKRPRDEVKYCATQLINIFAELQRLIDSPDALSSRRLFSTTNHILARLQRMIYSPSVKDDVLKLLDKGEHLLVLVEKSMLYFADESDPLTKDDIGSIDVVVLPDDYNDDKETGGREFIESQAGPSGIFTSSPIQQTEENEVTMVQSQKPLTTMPPQIVSQTQILPQPKNIDGSKQHVEHGKHIQLVETDQTTGGYVIPRQPDSQSKMSAKTSVSYTTTSQLSQPLTHNIVNPCTSIQSNIYGHNTSNSMAQASSNLVQSSVMNLGWNQTQLSQPTSTPMTFAPSLKPSSSKMILPSSEINVNSNANTDMSATQYRLPPNVRSASTNDYLTSFPNPGMIQPSLATVVSGLVSSSETNPPFYQFPPAITSNPNYSHYPIASVSETGVIVPTPSVANAENSPNNIRSNYPPSFPSSQMKMPTHSFNNSGLNRPSFAHRALNMNLSYDGSRNSPSIERFFFRVELLANSFGISQENLVIELQFVLRGTASEW